MEKKKKFYFKWDVVELYFVSLINIVINYFILCGLRFFIGIFDSWSFWVKVCRFIFIRKNGGDFFIWKVCDIIKVYIGIGLLVISMGCVVCDVNVYCFF